MTSTERKRIARQNQQAALRRVRTRAIVEQRRRLVRTEHASSDRRN